MPSRQKYIILLEEEVSPTGTSGGGGDSYGDDDEENTWIEFLVAKEHFMSPMTKVLSAGRPITTTTATKTATMRKIYKHDPLRGKI